MRGLLGRGQITAPQPAQAFGDRSHRHARPNPALMRRHILDEPDDDRRSADHLAKKGQVFLADRVRQDHIELDRRQTGLRSRPYPVQHVLDIAAAGQLTKAVRFDRVQADIDPVHAGLFQLFGIFHQQATVGRKRQVLQNIQRPNPPDQLDQTGAHQRLAAGQPHAGNAQSAQHAQHPQNFRIRQDFLFGQPAHAFRRNAVSAAVVTAVGDRKPQIFDFALVRINSHVCGCSLSFALRVIFSAGVKNSLPRQEGLSLESRINTANTFLGRDCPCLN